MNRAVATSRRRATVLLMVVSLLALLFLIVTGFLSVARTQEQTFVTVTEGDKREEIIDGINQLVIGQIKAQLVNGQGKIMGGGASERTETIPGYSKSHWLATLEPVWNAGWTGIPDIDYADLGSAYSLLDQIVWSAVTSLEGSLVSKPDFVSLVRLMFENAQDNDPVNPRFKASDVKENVLEGFMDADGDGVPDSSFVLDRLATEKANAFVENPVRLPEASSNFTIFSIGTLGGGGLPSRPTPLDAQGVAELAWRRFLETARFTAAVRVVSHGGMVALSGQQPMRGFLTDLFDAIADPDDTDRGSGLRRVPDQALDLFFTELEASRPQVEAALRHRFLLPLAGRAPGPIATSQSRFDPLRIPPILAVLEGRLDPRDLGQPQWTRLVFPETFNPQFARSGRSRLTDTINSRNGQLWQRINLADRDTSTDSERAAWARTQILRPDEANDRFGLNAVRAYSRRQLITSVSHGDLLARKLDPAERVLTGTVSTAPPDLHTWRGEQKFYLGEIAKAFERTALSADRVQYRFWLDPADVGRPTTSNAPLFWSNVEKLRSRGVFLVEEIARRFYDMLGAHDEWLADTEVVDDTPSTTDNKTIVSRRSQALMLAVNTPAFGSPRDSFPTGGWIDPVVYTDGTPTPTTYIGYAPQPFITEVVAYYGETDADDPNDPNQNDFSVAVELYNPNDPSFENNEDVFGLSLDQFRVVLTGDLVRSPWSSAPLAPLGGTWPAGTRRMNGRSFLAFSVSGTKGQGETAHHWNQFFNGQLDKDLGSTVSFDSGGQELVVELQRQAKSGFWYTIDRVRLNNIAKNKTPGAWWSVFRDTTPTPFFGAIDASALPKGGDLNGDGMPDAGMVDLDGDGTLELPARWSVVCIERRASGTNPDLQALGSAPQGQYYHRGGPNPFDPDTVPGTSPIPTDPWAPKRFAPIVPLITMNAAPFNDLPIFGRASDLRPRSFPTPGFMLFVPRFSHVITVVAGEPQSHPVSEVLRFYWEDKNYSVLKVDSSQPPPNNVILGYPADFGHMPVFDNTQGVPDGSFFDDDPAGTAGANGVGPLPWGLLVFDYFTTLDPTRDADNDGQPDIDPLAVPGLIDINNAPWYVLANLPLLGPTNSGQIPLLAYAAGLGPLTDAPSPTFWNPTVGGLVGGDLLSALAPPLSNESRPRHVGRVGGASLPPDVSRQLLPWRDKAPIQGLYRLGNALAQSAVAYRDGIQVLQPTDGAAGTFAQAHLRNGAGQVVLTGGTGAIPASAYRPSTYAPSGASAPPGGVRGARTDPNSIGPGQFGFITVGELLNVKGFDASLQLAGGQFIDLPPFRSAAFTALGRGDFVKAVSLMALLDTQYLTTRSHTFTIYASLVDRQNPAASVRSQVTIDRSNLVPRLMYEPLVPSDPATPRVPQVRLFGRDVDGDGVLDLEPVRIEDPSAKPTIISQRRGSFFNARYDN